MYTVEKNAVRLLAGTLLVVLAGGAAAQQAPQRPSVAPRPPHAQAAPPAPAAQGALPEPQRTTASYGDWVLRCEIQPGPPLQKTCAIEQLAQVQGQTNPISRAAVALPAKGEPPKLIVQLPVNVSLSAPVTITYDSKDPGISTPFRRCIPAGCFTEIDLKDDLQKKFRASAEAGKIQFKDSTEHEVAIPLSFKGFGQAFDALLKQ
jgi:invasion protein IalB